MMKVNLLIHPKQMQYTVLVSRNMLCGVPVSCSGMLGCFRFLLLTDLLRAEVAVKRGGEELLSQGRSLSCVLTTEIRKASCGQYLVI